MLRTAISARALRFAAPLGMIGLVAGPAAAHHSPAAFDLQKTVTIEGVVARYHWASPHVYIDVEGEDATGDKKIWRVEGAWPASLVPYGWSAKTLETGDAVVVTGNPARNTASRMVLGRSLRTGGVTRLLNVVPGTPPPDTSLTRLDRTGMLPAEALVGTWLPLDSKPLVFIDTGPWLTDEARAAVRNGRLRLGTGEEEAARCVPQGPPLNMSFQEAKAFEARGDDIIIDVVVVDDTKRFVHMNEGSNEHATPDREGYSVGHWEGDALVVVTTFAEDDEDRGIIKGVPWSEGTRLVEHFELSRDRKRLTYTYSVENPEYLTRPFTQSVHWAFRPDFEIPRLKCDADIAHRFLEN